MFSARCIRVAKSAESLDLTTEVEKEKSSTINIDPGTKKKMMSYRWVVFAVLAMAYFLVYFHRVSGGAAGDELIAAFDGSITTKELGLLASAYLYAYTIMQIPSGLLTDTLGPKKAASIFVVLIAIGSFMGAVAAMPEVQNFTLLVVGKFIIGIGAAVVYIPIMKVLAMWFRRKEFATMSGALLLVGNVGALAASTPMVMMFQNMGVTNTYAVLGVITLIIAVLCWLFIVDHPTNKGFPAIEEVESEETGNPITESTSEKISVWAALKEIFTSGRKFWPMAIWFFFLYGTVMLWQASLMGPYYNSSGLFTFDPAVVLMMPAVGFAIGCFLAGILADRVFHSKKKVLVIGTLAYTVVWAIIAFTCIDNLVVQAAINLGFGFFGGWFVVSYGQIKELYPISVAGTSSAAINLFPFLGGAVLTSISGFMITEYTPDQFQTVWIAALVMMIIACICAFLTVEKKDACA